MIDLQPDILCCTETRITSDINDGEILINNYECLRSNSTSRFSGGVIVYVRKEIKSKVIYEYVNGYDNILVIEIKNSIYKGTWIVVYHSPNASHSSFLQSFEDISQSYINNSVSTYIVGDFNINMHQSNTVTTYKERLRRITSAHYLNQKVKTPTYVRQYSKSIIDLVFIDKKNDVKVLVEENDMIADHKTVVMKKGKKKRELRLKIEHHIVQKS